MNIAIDFYIKGELIEGIKGNGSLDKFHNSLKYRKNNAN